jgi:hypothetical protein
MLNVSTRDMNSAPSLYRVDLRYRDRSGALRFSPWRGPVAPNGANPPVSKVYVSLLFARQLRYRHGKSLTGRGNVDSNPKLQCTFNSVRMKCSVKMAARQIED